MELGSVAPDELGELAVGWGADAQLCSTTISVWPLGSRNQNIGGTGSPMRAT